MRSLRDYGFVKLNVEIGEDLRRLEAQRDAALAEVERLREEQRMRPPPVLKPLGRPRKHVVVDLTSMSSYQVRSTAVSYFST